MALTDLLKGVRRAAAGLAVAVNTMYGCGGEEGEKNICEEYRQMCPFRIDPITGELTNEPSFSSEDFNYCVVKCVNERRRDIEMCGFTACALETGYCDDEVPNDPQITECAQKHGWL